jgi:hypothetical protein
MTSKVSEFIRVNKDIMDVRVTSGAYSALKGTGRICHPFLNAIRSLAPLGEKDSFL